MPGGYLRTNYRKVTSVLPINAIGKALIKGSWYGGAGCNLPCGGWVMHSVNQATSASDFVSVDAISVMNLFFGSDGSGRPLVGGTSGFRIQPIAYWLLSVGTSNAAAPASISLIPHYWPSVSLSDSIIRWFECGSGVSQAQSSFSAHFCWAGFIVSTPWS